MFSRDVNSLECRDIAIVSSTAWHLSEEGTIGTPLVVLHREVPLSEVALYTLERCPLFRVPLWRSCTVRLMEALAVCVIHNLRYCLFHVVNIISSITNDIHSSIHRRYMRELPHCESQFTHG